MDAPIKQAEADIDNLELEMYEVMGANEWGKKGNQLLEDDGKSYVNGMLHTYENIGDGLTAEQERKEEAARKGMLHAYGNMSPAGNDKPASLVHERKEVILQQVIQAAHVLRNYSFHQQSYCLTAPQRAHIKISASTEDFSERDQRIH